MADSRTPGPQCSLRNPANINDGTLCRQPSPRPGILGYWDSFESGIGSAYQSVAGEASYLYDSGASFAQFEYALAGRYGQAALDSAKKFLQDLVAKIKNAADWKTLNRLAEPILGQTSLQAGVLYGIGESLTGDVVSLLGLAKMIVLAGLYERIQHVGLASVLDPTMTAVALAAQLIPGLSAEMKKADEQLWKMLHELLEIGKHPINFIEAVGKSIKKDTLDDWNKLKDYAEHPSVTNDFQAGRIFGRVLYQVIMLILLVLSVAGAVAKLAARFPWLLRFARIIKTGGELEELEAAEKVQQTARTAEEIADAEKIKKPPKPVEDPAPKKPYSNPKSRPAYAKGQVDDVWEAAKQPDGKVYDPNTGEELTWDRSKSRFGQWDMGHKPGKEYWRLHKDYMDGKITKEEFLREYRDPNNYQPESPSENRSHRNELPRDQSTGDPPVPDDQSTSSSPGDGED